MLSGKYSTQGGITMFREMRRKKQMLSAQRCQEILKEGTCGVLAVLGDDDYPYAVPLNYVCDNGRIYFHCASEGHKLDALRKHSKVSFCVIAKDRVIPEEYRTDYLSVIAFGRIRILQQEQEKRKALEMLALRYTPKDPASRRNAEIDRFWDTVCMLEMTVEHLTGKEAKNPDA